MIDVNKDKEKVNRSLKAEMLLKDPLIKEALDALKDTVFKNIESSHYSKVDEREDLYKMLRAINGFESQFKKMIRDGELAKSRLDKFKETFSR